ncbi:MULTISPECIES: RNA-protein complex protein Nop10 [Acidianus]|uniref:Ribosome biogenesis protein Nop10 n=1 Tax=Candidatus Acidianus copahuensis TaxID=1160895 RepID=A0A031LMS8_9CREN|nr:MULTISPECIES: RNA-protein complex protein Nop10 [Acidianus]EZQ06943.1 ribosome biogenesis protein Nop10 [Candidatus Acidianus copahuensis]NON63479.1 RNA-protein complex protein Nop10 [Acidianus sp. RZ1]
MGWKIRKCPNDGTYTLRDYCPICGKPTVFSHPPRFSPVDKYVKYRIELKKGHKLDC